MKAIDYDEGICHQCQKEAIRLFLAFASYMGAFLVYQWMFKSAHLYGEIEEVLYVTQPKGFEDPYFPKHVYRVVKALYGLHQAPRAWYARLSAFLLQHNYRRGTIDKGTLFIKKDSRDISFVQVYVDDIILGQTNKARSMNVHYMYLTESSRPDIMFAVMEFPTISTPLTSHLHQSRRFSRSKSHVIEKSLQVMSQFFWRQNGLIHGSAKKHTIESTNALVKNPVFHQRTKHIEIRHHFIRDANEKNLIQVLKIHTDDNVADLLTQGSLMAENLSTGGPIGMVNPSFVN
ncbi:putative ribonuclease H-like domain-containing protein [Tanacetum coccineum]